MCSYVNKIKIKDFTIFNFSGICYVFIEMMWRGYSHYSMFFTGGLCFLILYKIYKKHREISYLKKYIIASIVITFIEFFVGFIFNIILKQKVWNYSNMPFNIYGQICLIYSFLWGFVGIFIDYLVNCKHTIKTSKFRSIKQ